MITTCANKYNELLNYITYATENEMCYKTRAGLVELQYVLTTKLGDKPLWLFNSWEAKHDYMELPDAELILQVMVSVSFEKEIKKLVCSKWVNVTHIADKGDVTEKDLDVVTYFVENMTDYQIMTNYQFFQSFLHSLKESITKLCAAEEDKIRNKTFGEQSKEFHEQAKENI